MFNSLKIPVAVTAQGFFYPKPEALKFINTLTMVQLAYMIVLLLFL